MSRYFSFAVLLAVIVLLIIMFYKLMVGFFVPLFLAALLVVIFNPLHKWFLKKCKGRNQLATGLTTTSVCLLVFAPLLLLFMLAASEGRIILQRFSSVGIVGQLVGLRQNLNLDIVAIEELRSLEKEFNDMVLLTNPATETETFLKLSKNVDRLSEKFRVAANLPTIPSDPVPEAETSAFDVPMRYFRSSTPAETWLEFRKDLKQLNQIVQEAAGSGAAGRPNPPENRSSGSIQSVDGLEQDPSMPPPQEPEAEPEESEQPDTPTPAEMVRETIRAFDAFKVAHCGGKTWSWLKLMANPTKEELDQSGERLSSFVRERLLTIGGATTAAIGNIIFGIIIMVVALYFFLLDGASMLHAMRQLSPLDEDHDERLIQEFATVSRAVVLATLLSALAQGILAGIGFWFCGFDQVFLLTILTICLAFVPFVGAAAVWVPACIWLYAVDGRTWAALGLAIYGSAVVSMVDNFIKPYVLHGQSNLHPLLALLSVLGGVTALGPIGILIGPMIVAFLQTTLEILRKELSILDDPLPIAAADGGETPKGNKDGSGQPPTRPNLSRLIKNRKKRKS